ncbi:hypothetical protein PFISCL1PPCAC_3448, partial [Pristionchus fissidentatus]
IFAPPVPTKLPSMHLKSARVVISEKVVPSRTKSLVSAPQVTPVAVGVVIVGSQPAFPPWAFIIALASPLASAVQGFGGAGVVLVPPGELGAQARAAETRRRATKTDCIMRREEEGEEEEDDGKDG